jgi:arylformamidase
MPRIIDLTLTVSPRLRGVEFEPKHTHQRDGFNTRTLHLYSHSGTHMDAPLHFASGDGTIDAVGDRTIDRIPLAHCVLPAWVAEITHLQPKALITVADLGSIAQQVHPGEGLLLRSGWSRHVEDPQYFRDNFPRISEELARWCIERGVRLLGVEPPSVADVNNMAECTAIHRLLLGAEIVIVEGLTNLTELQGQRVLFCAAPLKIEAGDGSPCRAFAIELDAATIATMFPSV